MMQHSGGWSRGIHNSGIGASYPLRGAPPNLQQELNGSRIVELQVSNLKSLSH